MGVVKKILKPAQKIFTQKDFLAGRCTKDGLPLKGDSAMEEERQVPGPEAASQPEPEAQPEAPVDPIEPQAEEVAEEEVEEVEEDVEEEPKKEE